MILIKLNAFFKIFIYFKIYHSTIAVFSCENDDTLLCTQRTTPYIHEFLMFGHDILILKHVLYNMNYNMIYIIDDILPFYYNYMIIGYDHMTHD